jgi:hypothetical protein
VYLNLASKFVIHERTRFFYTPQSWDIGQKEGMLRIFSTEKNPTAFLKLCFICSYRVLCCSGIVLVFDEGRHAVDFSSRKNQTAFFLSYLVLHRSNIGLSIVVCIVSYCMLWIRRLRSGASPRS